MSKTNEHLSLGKALLDAIGEAYGQDADKLGPGDEQGHITMTNAKQVCLDMMLAGSYY